MVREPNIQAVVDSGLCAGCGTCVSVCPENAVEMTETPGGFLVPKVDASACNLCGTCAEVCPGSHLAPGLMEDGVDPFKGKVLAAFVAQATDRELLLGAQSGGAVTALLCHLLDRGQIGSAIVTQMPRDGSLRPRAVRASCREEILKARGSVYCPVAVNAALRSGTGGHGRKTALVGLPCHVHGLRNAQACCSDHVGEVSIIIGLICAGIFSYHAIDHLVGLTGLSVADVSDLRYRSKERHGWPGDVRIRLKDGAVMWVRKEERLRCKPAFEALPCRLCFDQMNILSDVVVGDPWGLEESREGCSVVIARSENGLDAILSAERAGVLKLDPVAADAVFAGQTVDSRQRPDWSAFTAAWGGMGHPCPDFSIEQKWRVETNAIDLAPYRRRLTWSLSLAKSRTKAEAEKMAARRLSLLRLRAAMSPKRIGTWVLRRVWQGLTRKKRPRGVGTTKNITMFGAYFSGNFGGPSVIVGAMKALSLYFPDAEYTLFVSRQAGISEKEIASKHGVKLVWARRFPKTLFASALLWRLFGCVVGFPLAIRAMRPFLEADLLVDVSGIKFADPLGSESLRGRVTDGAYWLVGRLLGKSLIKYTSAFGPCKQKWNRRLAKFYLQHCCDLIMARDPLSLQEVRRIGVTTDGLVCPDSGFLLEASTSYASRRISCIRKTRPIVGVSISHTVQRHARSPQAYVTAMSRLIEHVMEELSGHVVLIPNEAGRGSADDRRVAETIYSELKPVHCEVLSLGGLQAEGLKGVIGECDAMVAARYHTIVASLSLGVPVLAVAWHHKYAEVLKLFGQEKNLCDIKHCRPSELVEIFDQLWENRDQVRNDILSRLPAIKQGIYAGAKQVHSLLRARGQKPSASGVDRWAKGNASGSVRFSDSP